jgi:hypothetical protein
MNSNFWKNQFAKIFNLKISPIILGAFVLNFYPQVFSQQGKICIVETREYAGKDPSMWDGLYVASDGKVYTGLATEGKTSHFYVYDPATDSMRMIADIAEFLGEQGKGIRTSGKIHNKAVEDLEGNIYFTTINNGAGPRNIDYTSWQGGRWLKYNPSQDKLEDLGLIDDGVGLYPLVIDKERGYLFGTGFTGYLYRFDINNKVTKVLGRVANWDICRNIFCDDKGNVYGAFPVARVWKYDSSTENIIDLPVRIPYDPTFYPTQLINPMIDRTTIWRAIRWDPEDKVAYGITGGSGSILFKFDPHAKDGEQITELTKMCDTKFLNNEHKDVPFSTLAFDVDIKNKRVYHVPSPRDYVLDTYAETLQGEEPNHLIMYDIKTNQTVDLGELRTKDGRSVFGCEAMAVAADGTVYICGLVEVKDENKATNKVGDKLAALKLIIYKPQF